MPFLPDEQRARLLLESFAGWFGPPVVRFQGKVFDGSKRLAAWRALSFRGDPPTLEPRDARACARLILLSGHVERAHAMLGDSIAYDANTATVLRVPPEVGAALVGHVRRRGKRRPPPRRREEVIERVRELYLQAAEAGKPITRDDLRKALGTWA